MLEFWTLIIFAIGSLRTARVLGVAVPLWLRGKLRGRCSFRKAWERFLMALTARGARLGFPLLLLFALVLGAASPAQAAEKFCSEPLLRRD